MKSLTCSSGNFAGTRPTRRDSRVQGLKAARRHQTPYPCLFSPRQDSLSSRATQILTVSTWFFTTSCMENPVILGSASLIYCWT